MGNDACSLVKIDLEAGSFTNYTKGDIVVYIEKKEKFLGGNAYILLKDSTRQPLQSFTGSLIYTKGGCSIDIFADSDTDRDNIYADIIAILNDTNRGYTFDFGSDLPHSEQSLELSIDVSLFL